MRVLLGLSALALVSAQSTTVTVNRNSGQSITGAYSQALVVGQSAYAQITVQWNNQQGNSASTTPALSPTLGGGFYASNNWQVYVPYSVSALSFTFLTNAWTGQMQYRWYPNYNPTTQYPNSNLNSESYTCDPCSDVNQQGTPISCQTSTGPGAGLSPAAGFPCSLLSRNYIMSNLVPQTPSQQSLTNSFSFLTFDINQAPGPNLSSYSFTIVRLQNPVIVGDPQIVGMQGQDFQVHGVPDEIFNLITYPTVQVNARFTYLESAECHDNFTVCFAHPGTYITEEGFRIGKDKVRVTAGSYKKGLTVHVNGKKIKSNTDLTSGAVQIVDHRRVVVHTDIMKIGMSNSDNFFNQDIELMDDKLVTLGTKRVVLKDNERYHPEVPLHGLQGQTWRNVEYPSGLDYEGSIMDYHVVDGNIYGTDFVFNQFEA